MTFSGMLWAAPLTYIIEGGTVFAGNGKPGVKADVGISGQRIAYLGDLEEFEAEVRLDATGLYVIPGIIDIHSHAVRNEVDRSGLFLFPDAESYIRQGVTSAIGGPDGRSWYPIAPLLAKIEGDPPAINFGTFVGHNEVRENVMGRENRQPTAEELEQMKSMVELAMREGAFGLSSGLKYIPGAYADREEVVALAQVAAGHGGIYISHMRDEGLGVIDSVLETIAIGENAGIPSQITHHKIVGAPMWGKSQETLALVDAAIARGVDVSIDQYPYTASSTGIRVLIPAWAQAGGREVRLARYTDPQEVPAILKGIVENLISDRGGNDPARVVLADCRWDRSLNGLSLSEVLLQRGLPTSMENAAELVLELEKSGGCSAVFHAMSEEDVVRIMRHKRTMIASDGGIFLPGESVPHPRNYGSFARVLGRYVREQSVLGFSEAVHKMTHQPALRIGLKGRGEISEGAIADVAVLDPDAVVDQASFEDPHQFSKGVKHVLVNGKAVLLDGEMTGARPGVVLRSTD